MQVLSPKFKKPELKKYRSILNFNWKTIKKCKIRPYSIKTACFALKISSKKWGFGSLNDKNLFNNSKHLKNTQKTHTQRSVKASNFVAYTQMLQIERMNRSKQINRLLFCIVVVTQTTDRELFLKQVWNWYERNCVFICVFFVRFKLEIKVVFLWKKFLLDFVLLFINSCLNFASNFFIWILRQFLILIFSYQFF
jgi:hypothetical protein